MANFTVFQYVVFHQPIKQKDEQALKPVIIKDVTTVVEKSADLVKMKAVRELDEKWIDKLDEIVIAVKPF